MKKKWNHKANNKIHPIISLIASRALGIFLNQGYTMDIKNLIMDLHCVAFHIPMDFERMLKAENKDFIHDILGIIKNLDRDTQMLKNMFHPRFAK